MEYAGAEKNAYIGRYLRAFDAHLAAYPSVDLRSALQAADAHFEDTPDRSDPEGDACEEADCWRNAT